MHLNANVTEKPELKCLGGVSECLDASPGLLSGGIADLDLNCQQSACTAAILGATVPEVLLFKFPFSGLSFFEHSSCAMVNRSRIMLPQQKDVHWTHITAVPGSPSEFWGLPSISPATVQTVSPVHLHANARANMYGTTSTVRAITGRKLAPSNLQRLHAVSNSFVLGLSSSQATLRVWKGDATTGAMHDEGTWRLEPSLLWEALAMQDDHIYVLGHSDAHLEYAVWRFRSPVARSSDA